MEVQGGMRRDGWNPLGIRRKKLLKEGIDGTALVKLFSMFEDDEGMQYQFKLEVRIEGREPYELGGLFHTPGNLAGRVRSGAVVPVKAHPSEPKRVAIDWDRWDASTWEGVETEQSAAMTAMASSGDLDDEPGMNASLHETLDWQLAKGFIDQATYDMIIANLPETK
jgi:hypothetical protein